MIICLDGPAGSGKSTISQQVAMRAGYIYLDTGAFYRSLAHAAQKDGTDWKDAAALADLAAETALDFKWDGEINRVFLNGQDVTLAIRTPDISRGSSIVSQYQQVRSRLVELQREIGNRQSCVVEGRDTGTVVFPKAELKIYLDASLEVRARRRFLDFQKSGDSINFEEVMSSLAERDRLDSEREASPLSQAEDAIHLDTSEMTPEQVIRQILTWIEEKRAD